LSLSVIVYLTIMYMGGIKIEFLQLP